MSHIWMHESCSIYGLPVCGMSHVAHKNTWIMSHIRIHVPWIMSRVWTAGMLKESCPTYECIAGMLKESCPTYECMSHVTRRYVEGVMSHICMSHILKESCRTYECMSHVTYELELHALAVQLIHTRDNLQYSGLRQCSSLLQKWCSSILHIRLLAKQAIYALNPKP